RSASGVFLETQLVGELIEVGAGADGQPAAGVARVDHGDSTLGAEIETADLDDAGARGAAFSNVQMLAQRLGERLVAVWAETAALELLRAFAADEHRRGPVGASPAGDHTGFQLLRSSATRSTS